jgi:hypothetical protein
LGWYHHILVVMPKSLLRCNNPRFLSQLHFGQVWGWSPTLPKLGIWSLPGLSNVYSSTTRPKTPRIEVFLVSLERSWSVDNENDLALTIWTFVTQVMGKRRARSQTAKKSGINLFPTSELKVRYVVEKILTRATSLVQTSLRSDVAVESYELPKSRDSNRDSFGTISGLQLGVPGKRAREKEPFGCSPRNVAHRILYGGRWWLPPSPGRGVSCGTKCPWLVPTPKGVPECKLTTLWFVLDAESSLIY